MKLLNPDHSTFLTGVHSNAGGQITSSTTTKQQEVGFPNSEEINHNFQKLDDMILVKSLVDVRADAYRTWGTS